MDSKRVQELIDKHAQDHAGLISILEKIQDKYSYLPAAALRQVSEGLGVPLVDVFGVATFYKSFSLRPRGRHLISVCQGTACHVKSSAQVVQEFQRQLTIGPGDTTADGEFTFETVNCLGACALGPVVVIDGHYFTAVQKSEVGGLLERTQAGLDKLDFQGDSRIFPLNVACPRCNHSLLDSTKEIDGYPAIHVTASFHRKHGSMRLSCLYGSYVVESVHTIPEDTIVDLFCPHCHGELTGATDCPACDARMVPMMVRGGGVLLICSRKGCREHRLDLNGVNV